MNPARSCRMCHNAVDALATALLMPELDMPLTDPEVALLKLRTLCHECPACILSVIRQSKSTLLAYEFRFKEEAAAWWQKINDETAVREYLAEKAYL
jgi:hypothetical protein